MVEEQTTSLQDFSLGFMIDTLDFFTQKNKALDQEVQLLPRIFQRISEDFKFLYLLTIWQLEVGKGTKIEVQDFLKHLND